MSLGSVRRERFREFSILHREVVGEPNATIHFLHATGFNAQTYRRLFEALDPSLDVYGMDARGHGLTEAPARPQKLRSWTPFRRDLEAFIETLRAPRILAGHSMGATVSMELAAFRPELVQGLVMLDPVVVPPARVVAATAARLLGLSDRLVPIARMAAKRTMEFPSKEAAVENFVGKGPFRTWQRGWIEDYVEGGTMPVEGGVRLSCDRDWESRTFAVSTTSPYRLLRKVRCPITLVVPERDAPPFSLASRAAFMKLKPDTRLVVLPGASHHLVMERPELVQTEIERMAATVA